MSNKISKFLTLSILKTLRFNFHYFSFRDACKFPILISRRVKLRILKGQVIIKSPIKTGIIQIGFNTLGLVDYSRERVIWDNLGKITFNGRAIIGAASRICVLRNAKLNIGDNVSITGLSSIITRHKILIGKDCLIAWESIIMDTDFHHILSIKDKSIGNPDQSIKIGDHVWIGCRTTILKGTNIPENSVIAAGTIVSGNLLNSNAIYAGNPVHIIKQNIDWEE